MFPNHKDHTRSAFYFFLESTCLFFFEYVAYRAGSVVQLVVCLPSMFQTVGWIPSTAETCCGGACLWFQHSGGSRPRSFKSILHHPLSWRLCCGSAFGGHSVVASRSIHSLLLSLGIVEIYFLPFLVLVDFSTVKFISISVGLFSIPAGKDSSLKPRRTGWRGSSLSPYLPIGIQLPYLSEYPDLTCIWTWTSTNSHLATLRTGPTVGILSLLHW